MNTVIHDSSDPSAIDAARVSKESQPELFARVTLDWAHGRCAWFALALNQRFGWPIEGFVDSRERVVHVVNVVNGKLFDAYGFGERADVISSFVTLGSPGIRHVGRLTPKQVREAFFIESSKSNQDFNAALTACMDLAHGLNIPLERLTVPDVSDADHTFRARKADRSAYFWKFVYGWKLRKCSACNGSGYYDHNGSPPCGSCEGSCRERYRGSKSLGFNGRDAST
jgi:uncharacterized protein YbbK (DUF523 family)